MSNYRYIVELMRKGKHFETHNFDLQSQADEFLASEVMNEFRINKCILPYRLKQRQKNGSYKIVLELCWNEDEKN